MYILIKPVYHRLKDGIEFLGSFHKERSMKNIAHVICDTKGFIKDLTASCSNILGLDVMRI